MIGFLLFEKMQIFILSFYVGHIQMYFSKIWNRCFCNFLKRLT
jgi:hypothetical protein